MGESWANKEVDHFIIWMIVYQNKKRVYENKNVKLCTERIVSSLLITSLSLFIIYINIK